MAPRRNAVIGVAGGARNVRTPRVSKPHDSIKHTGVMADVERDRPGRRDRRRDELARTLGGGLLLATVAVILVGPDFMSRWTLAGIQLACVGVGAAYGMYLAAATRHTHVTLERAYSTHLEELSQRLRNMAYRDAVTGLYNHRYFREQLTHEIERSTRYAQPLALLVMDLNGFKQINDLYGHLTGDRFLGLVGEVIDRELRASDIGARYGGDEFVAILPNTTLAEARAAAAKLSIAVASAAAITTSGESVQLGISCGAAVCPDDARTPGELIERADARLYEVKAQRKAKHVA